MKRPAFRCAAVLALALPAVAGAQAFRIGVPVPVTPMPGGGFPRIPIPSLPGLSLTPAQLPGPVLMPAMDLLPSPAVLVPVMPVERMLPILRKAYGLQPAAESAPGPALAASRVAASLKAPAAMPVDGMIRALRVSFGMDEEGAKDRPAAQGMDRVFDGGTEPSEAAPVVPASSPRPRRRAGVQSLPEQDLEEELGI